MVLIMIKIITRYPILENHFYTIGIIIQTEQFERVDCSILLPTLKMHDIFIQVTYRWLPDKYQENNTDALMQLITFWIWQFSLPKKK